MPLISFLLVVEGLTTGWWLARILPSIQGYDRAALILVAARTVIGGMQLAGGFFLLGRRLAAGTLARFALLASAMLTTFEIGGRMAPTDLDPTFRWPLVIAYWVYAFGASIYIGLHIDAGSRAPQPPARETRRDSITGPEAPSADPLEPPDAPDRNTPPTSPA
jgi:hypothetical protein